MKVSFRAPRQASLRSLRKLGCVRRARNPVSSAGDYWNFRLSAFQASTRNDGHMIRISETLY